MPASAGGTTANVTAGIATAFASGETSDACWNSASVSGAIPTVTSHCACAAARRLRAAGPRS